MEARLSYQGTGRRKNAVARVTLTPGGGEITVNGLPLSDYFGRDILEEVVKQPLEKTGTLANFDIEVNVRGGGVSGQAGAIRHAIARALLDADEEEYRSALKRAGYLTRDPRMKERKKPGLRKARRAPQFSKR